MPVVSLRFTLVAIAMAVLVLAVSAVTRLPHHLGVLSTMRTVSLIGLAVAIIWAALGKIQSGDEWSEVAYWFILIALTNVFVYSQAVLGVERGGS